MLEWASFVVVCVFVCFEPVCLSPMPVVMKLLSSRSVSE